MRKGDKKKWLALREEIWNERPHVSEISDKPLLDKMHPLWHWQFLHILPHGTYPEFGLRKENIMLATWEEHQNQHKHKAFTDKADELRAQYYAEGYGK